MFKVLRNNLKSLSDFNKSSLDSTFRIFTSFKNFSGHHSGSDSEHDDHHHHSTSNSENSETEDHLSLLRSRAFSKVPKKFSVDEILNKVNTPITKKIEEHQSTAIFKTEVEYIDFLTVEFEKKALLKYPEYKDDVDSFKHRIIDYEKLNPYQKEVQTLNLYLLNKLDKERIELTKAFQGANEGTPLEQAKKRLNLFQSKLFKLKITRHFSKEP
jgi:hypothetical protein